MYIMEPHSMDSVSSSASNALPNEPLHIAIVGAGPRGTSILERLCASMPDILGPDASLIIHVIDPASPGAGAIWTTSQSSQLQMNTVACQMTLFTDESVDCLGPKRPGPSLYEWAAVRYGESELGPNDYATRAQYGRYLEWVFNKVLSEAPPNIQIQVHYDLAIELDDAPDGSQVIRFSTGETLPGLAAVALAQGHRPLQPSLEQRQLLAHARQHNLKVVLSGSPADSDLSSIAPGEKVLLYGLGLSFFDYMTLLTKGRGGRFDRTPCGDLYYCPSGAEPFLYAGSRRGIPYHARGDNQKGPSERHTSLLLTQDVIARFRHRADSGDPPNFRKEIWPLIAREIELVYYETMLKQYDLEQSKFRLRFLTNPHDRSHDSQLLDEFNIPIADRWSWEHILQPYDQDALTSVTTWRNWLMQYLREDSRSAALGNVNGPLKAALDVMRDLRQEIGQIVSYNGLSGISKRDDLDNWYTPMNAFLSLGPPRERIEQMIALMEAGVLDILGPQPMVRADGKAWLAQSSMLPSYSVRVTTIIEAHVPQPDLQHTADELLAYLLNTGQCRPHRVDDVDDYEAKGLDISPSPYNIIGREGNVHKKRFAIGVPTEGVHWVTAAGARPGVNSGMLRETDAVARAMLTAVV